MLYAASPEVQRAYALVEGTYQDVGALPGHPATFRISKVHHILSMEVRLHQLCRCPSASTLCIQHVVNCGHSTLKVLTGSIL
jgi:hypothetical protein